MAPSRFEQSAESAVQLLGLLNDILKSPERFRTNDALVAALRSQGSLAQYSDPSRGIKATSLNALKRVTKRAIDGGFAHLDLRRRECLATITKSATSQSRRKTSTEVLSQRVQSLEAELLQALQDLAHITLVLQRSLTQGYSYAERSGSSTLLELCKKEQRELKARLSLCQQPTARMDRPSKCR